MSFEISRENLTTLLPFGIACALFGYGVKTLLTKNSGFCNPGVSKNESKVVHTMDMENLGEKAVFCRCWRSSKFPYCDGSHTKHNENTGDNVGPLIVKKKGK